jgi:hypothetical protein
MVETVFFIVVIILASEKRARSLFLNYRTSHPRRILRTYMCGSDGSSQQTSK